MTGRRFNRALLPIVIATAALPAAPLIGFSSRATAQHQTTAAHVHAILGVAITVSDLEQAIEWYSNTLDAELISQLTLEGDTFARLTGMFGATARVAEMRLGNERFDLVQYLTPIGRPCPPDTRSNDRWFQHMAIIVRDMKEAYQHLDSRGVDHASPSPQRLPAWNPDAGGISAFYFRDPDGHFLEILEFPKGKGEERWQNNDSLFLGIDHTAIVVDDTDAALRFYRDQLGLRVVGESQNWGEEQEHLNTVFAARLRITALRADAGPAIELLEYQTPRTGRAMPIDTTPADLWHWQIFVTCNRPDAVFEECRAAGGAPISPGAQSVTWPHTPASTKCLLARDPDGHALLFVGANRLE